MKTIYEGEDYKEVCISTGTPWGRNELVHAVPILAQRHLRSHSLRQMNLADLPPLVDLDLISQLDLAENGLRLLPNFLLRMINLTILNLSSNILREPPSVLYNGLYTLKKLDLSYNGLTDFNVAPCCLTLLEDINLSHNQLRSPPGWLIDERPSRLTILNLSWNPCFVKIRNIPSRKSQVQVSDNIKILDLTNCGFRDRHIQYLDNFSKLRRIIIATEPNCSPEQRNCFKEFKKLSKTIMSVYAKRTGIITLVPGLVSRISLRELNVSSNILNWIPTPFGKLKKLVVLKAENCRINFLPVEMNQLINLRELYLAYNELYSFEHSELTNLEILDLYMNDILNSPKLDTLVNLKALDVDRNLFKPHTVIQINGEDISYTKLKSKYRSLINTYDRLEGIRPTSNKCRVTEIFDQDYDEPSNSEGWTNDSNGRTMDDNIESEDFEEYDISQNDDISGDRVWKLWKKRQQDAEQCLVSTSSDESSASHKYTSYRR